ncbi:MAG: hypothetical protein P9M00_03710 [Candidatus Tritonobacter lacicola]|nr:hypothetical protein [Candidatus Tritonobacter lacicola]
MEFLAGKIDALTNILAESDLELDPGAAPHELADKIEQLLREKSKEL